MARRLSNLQVVHNDIREKPSFVLEAGETGIMTALYNHYEPAYDKIEGNG
jgi:hypothetical protein